MVEADRFAAASRLFVVLKHKTRQAFDMAWALKNPDYAREVLEAARRAADPELGLLADRFEQAMFGTVSAVPAPAADEPEPQPPAPLNGRKYVGALR